MREPTAGGVCGTPRGRKWRSSFVTERSVVGVAGGGGQGMDCDVCM
jgi:hypothetical protein